MVRDPQFSQRRARAIGPGFKKAHHCSPVRLTWIWELPGPQRKEFMTVRRREAFTCLSWVSQKGQMKVSGVILFFI